jgi:hypothetical protein
MVIWPLWAQVFVLPSIGIILTSVGVWVAVQQMRIARIKTQHDLFDRRFRIYESALAVTGEYVRYGNLRRGMLEEYRSEILALQLRFVR